ncbi:MAG TPA: adenosine kinase [Spirochaetales bacterium]|nr:adenosine kinase [Spirochaetales bacterium]
MRSVYIIENPLVDHIAHESYGFVERFGSRPGTMQLVDRATFEAVVAAARSVSLVPGGSGANTARALAMLQGPGGGAFGRPAYAGAIGRDKAGEAFAAGLADAGVDSFLALKDDATGSSAIVVTPDHERTMFTNLGACQNYGPADLDLSPLEDSRYFYSTGYMWDTPPQKEALLAAVDAALSKRVPVCFDLADPFVVDRYYAELRDWLPGHVEVLFGNRAELSRLCDCEGPDPEIVRLASRYAPVVAMKIGKGGCLVRSRERLVHAPGELVVPVDTTGAGDSFAAGFLYGLLAGADLGACGRLANRVASRIVAAGGCRYDLLDRADCLAALD